MGTDNRNEIQFRFNGRGYIKAIQSYYKSSSQEEREWRFVFDGSMYDVVSWISNLC